MISTSRKSRNGGSSFQLKLMGKRSPPLVGLSDCRAKLTAKHTTLALHASQGESGEKPDDFGALHALCGLRTNHTKGRDTPWATFPISVYNFQSLHTTDLSSVPNQLLWSIKKARRETGGRTGIGTVARFCRTGSELPDQVTNM